MAQISDDCIVIFYDVIPLILTQTKKGIKEKESFKFKGFQVFYNNSSYTNPHLGSAPHVLFLAQTALENALILPVIITKDIQGWFHQFQESNLVKNFIKEDF